MRNALTCGFLVAGIVAASGCDALFSGLPPDDEVFDGPIEGLTAAQTQTFLAGDEAFGEVFTPATGLGPVFNHTACSNCHPDDGRGHPATNLIRFGRGDATDASRFDYMLAFGGPQLQDRAIPGYPPETLPPNITGRSERGGPHVVGLGLIEAIPEKTLLARVDEKDKDGDGISGRANYVKAPEGLTIPSATIAVNGRYLGRFGRKATTITLEHQTVGAYLNDMGVTSDLLAKDVVNPRAGAFTGDQAADPEVASATVANVVFYLRTLKPPARRDEDAAEVKAGDKLFGSIGCAACHVPEMRTGSHAVAALSDKPVRLYSDLLLHDVGDALADRYPEGLATGREWRTPPLWGLGIVANVLGGRAYYLHDGRTTSLNEAIRLHGGEAQASRDKYVALSAADRAAVLRFLGSL